MTQDLAIIGVGQTPYRRRHEGSTPELVHAAVSEALRHSGLGHRDIDIVVGGFAPDALAGENCPDRRFLPAAGAVGKWSLRVNTGGTTGIAAAYAAMDLLEAGHGDAALVVAVERMAQARSVPAVFNSIFDPVYERDTGLSTVSMGALRAARMMQRWGYTAGLWARVAERNFAHAARNPLAQIRVPHTAADVLASRMLAWPIRQLDACPISEGVCAVVVARASAADRPPGRAGAGPGDTHRYVQHGRPDRPPRATWSSCLPSSSPPPGRWPRRAWPRRRTRTWWRSTRRSRTPRPWLTHRCGSAPPRTARRCSRRGSGTGTRAARCSTRRRPAGREPGRRDRADPARRVRAAGHGRGR